jgi:hypothetical protein
MPSMMKAPSPPSPISPVTVTRPMVVTVAMRTPAMITGRASGSSTRRSWLSGRYPMPWAASLTSSGTPSSPATMFLTRMSRV